MFFVKNKNKISKKGFTLIELMVSIGLFATVMTVSTGIILSIIGGNKKAQQINSVASNLNFALESMVRDLKTGYTYYCTDQDPNVKDNYKDASARGCDGRSDIIQFISTLSGRERVARYKYESNGVGGGYLSKQTCNINSVTNIAEDCTFYTRVTSPDIDLKEVSFYVKAPKAGDDEQPAVLVIIRGTTNIDRNIASDFHIQTYVSQRVLNI